MHFQSMMAYLFTLHSLGPLEANKRILLIKTETPKAFKELKLKNN